LCHAWGASPIYLLGKYYLGVKPTAPGYQTYVIEPQLGGLKWMEGAIPTPNGDIKVHCTTNKINVSSATGTGKLHIKSKTKPVCKGETLKALGNNTYELLIQKDKAYAVQYTAL
jgi:hypothetical protein